MLYFLFYIPRWTEFKFESQITFPAFTQQTDGIFSSVPIGFGCLCHKAIRVIINVFPSFEVLSWPDIYSENTGRSNCVKVPLESDVRAEAVPAAILLCSRHPPFVSSVLTNN